MGKFDKLSVSLEKRSTVRQEDARNASGLTRVSYTLDVAGVGEAAVNIVFPVAFVEEPAFWFGSVYAGTTMTNPATEWTSGAMPAASAIVLAWAPDPLRANTFVGAYMGLVTVGAGEDNFRVQVHFEAKTLDRPRA